MEFSYNPYYSPEKCGLEIFQTVSTGRCYEFDMLVVWIKTDDKTLWWASDSGCSCPTPFDPGRHDLEQITKETFDYFDNALARHPDIDHGDYMEVSSAVRKYLKMRSRRAPK